MRSGTPLSSDFGLRTPHGTGQNFPRNVLHSETPSIPPFLLYPIGVIPALRSHSFTYHLLWLHPIFPYRHFPQINPQIYNPVLAPASQRTQTNTSGTESGPRTQVIKFEFRTHYKQTEKTNEVQIVPGTRQQLKLSLVMTWENVPVERNATLGLVIQTFGKWGEPTHTMTVKLTGYC